GLLAHRGGVHRGGRRDRRALPLRLPDGQRGRPRAEPDPGRGAPDRRLPDHADRPARRPDGRQPLAPGGRPGAPARARAAPRERARRRAARARRRAAGGATRPAVSAPASACLFGTYDAGHSANRLLGLALAGAGWRVGECHEPLWEETRTKGRRYFGAPSLALLGARWAAAARRLVRRWRRLAGPPPLVVVGFGGQLDVLLARRLCRPRAGLVFAPLVSLTETLADDRRLVAPGGPCARALARIHRARPRAEALGRGGARIAWRDAVPLASLPAELAAAAVVLGVFGASQKAAMVVPNKVWQAAAAGRPLVTRDGPALREVLRPGEHCVACPPADPASLAEAIGSLLDAPGFAESLGRAARAH